MTVNKEDFSITTNKTKLDIDYIHLFLTQSYWAKGIPKQTVAKSIEGSLCFGVFHQEKQIGFARMITDCATFAYLADVFIDEAYRGQGLAKWMMQIIMQQPELQGLRRILLATRDAHGLYVQVGFTSLNNPERWMQIHQPDVYQQ